MNNFIRTLIAALALLAVCAPVAYSDDDDDDGDRPTVTARPAAPVWDSSARLRAFIDPEVDDDDDDDDDEDDDGGGVATYRFQFGTTAAYGQVTPAGTLSGDDKVMAATEVTGLKPETTYHFRAVASNASGTTYGPDTTFTTLRKTSAGGKGSAGDASEPTLGRTVVVRAAAGEVLVRERGESEFHPIDKAEKLLVDSTIDTREGVVKLESALPSGDSQTGTFWGGKFQVRQSRSGDGMTNIALRGGSFASCAAGRSARVPATYRKSETQRKLWAKDKGGRFKTSGKGSVATVRGTAWYTEDRCDGTLTKVKHGAVLVREKGSGRTRLLRAGQSFLARINR